MKKIAIIGGGIIGLATAYRLLERKSSVKIVLFEKEDKVGAHQSSHNSGVLHAGLYYKPGSEKALLAVKGIKQMVQFCKSHNIPHEICGKLVVATNLEELERLKGLLERGIANGLTGLKLLDKSEIRKYEPNVNGISAIYVPEEGIVDYSSVCDRLAGIIQEKGGEIKLNHRVTALNFTDGVWEIKTNYGEFSVDFIINCAGLYCDRIARMAGEKPQIQIIPFRGEYYKIRKEKENIVKNLVYPVPSPEFPFLGVHFTRLIYGGLEAGPNAALAFSREGYDFWKINPFDLLETLSFIGFWRFLKNYPEMVKRELKISLSKNYFCGQLKRLVPDIEVTDLEKGGSGVRAQALDKNGDLIQDFCILKSQNALHILNAPSPAATASLAIGERIASLIAV